MDADVIKRHDGEKKSKMVEGLKKQLYDLDHWKSAAAEFLATFIFLFIVCLTYILPLNVNNSSTSTSVGSEESSSIQANIGIALTYATLIQCFEDISGGYMNPVISISMAVAGRLSVFRAILYSIAQMTGAFSAVAVCFGMFPNPTYQKRSLSSLHDDITPLQGFGIETLQSFILTVTWLATYLNSKIQLGSSALPVGLAFLGNSLWAGQLTGSNANPARSVPPAVLIHSWNNLWIYIIGPLTGSVFGSLLYTHVLAIGITKKKRRSGVGAGRNIEGESVKSDQDTLEQLQPFNQETEIQTTNFSSVHNNRLAGLSKVQQTAIYYPQSTLQGSPSVLQHGMPSAANNSLSRTNHFCLPQNQKLYRQGSVPSQIAMTRRSMSYTPSNGSTSNNVTLTRENSRVASRASITHGAPTPKPLNGGVDGFVCGQGPSMSFMTNYPTSNIVDPLINEGVH